MTKLNLEKLIQYIVDKSVKLKDKYTDELGAKVEFADVFSQAEYEYQQLSDAISKLGKIVFSNTSGNIYSLEKPIKTIAGELYLVKIRKPDDKYRLRGDADFYTNYSKLKQKYEHHSSFELIVREKFEMLRLSDPKFDVMTCFSNIPVRNWI